MPEHLFYSLEGPLDALPAERQTRAANLAGFPDFVRNLGGDPFRVLERHGMDPRTIRDPDHYISCKSLVDVLEYCSTSFDDPLFGLRLAQFQEAELYGCVTALCRAAPSFRDAVSGFIEYLPVVHSPESVLELTEGKDTAELIWRIPTDLGINIQANYQAALLNMKLLRLIGGRAFRPKYVRLTIDARQKDVPEIEERMGCRFYTDEEVNCIGFPAAILDQPNISSNRLLYRLLSGYLGRVKEAARTTLVDRVEDYVRGALPAGNCSVLRCAKKLGTSVRTLQSQLSDCGLKFSDILERERIELAKMYLWQGQLSLDEVAAMLGYSEQSSFGRAFKRWTGSTPLRFRAERSAASASSSQLGLC